jgi:DNA-binding NtrC family response regulator
MLPCGLILASINWQFAKLNQAETAALREDTKMRHVLIVDDDTHLLQAFTKYLPRMSHNLIVNACESSLKALELVEKTDFDTIVLDIKMPEMDGLSLLREIRKIRPLTPVLVITGYYGDYVQALEALRGGATDFIHKPMEWDQFVACLEVAMQSYQAIKEKEEERLSLGHSVQELEKLLRDQTCKPYTDRG